ncbi:DNA ligase [Alcanivorax sp. S71-1-4]|uniref:DNA ligase n=1 Tax=Alcanivorax sp. S71-1-4 TaxID=1177159 RepID=UPI0016A91A22|nr:DNA ligase [Alcanivorax sp. S71-1-4]KAF0806110.1 DNA ligase [Alcanivorax sp. S71-1-4]
MKYLILFCLLLCGTGAARAAPPAILLASDYAGETALHAFWVSEKLDGVRARWDGEQLVSRQGNVFNAPAWFTHGFPEVSLDGELWLGRGRFADASGAVRRQQPDAAQWRELRFMIFDLPSHPGTFDERLAALRELFATSPSPYMVLIDQFRVADRTELLARLDTVVAQGGEGLMLHHGSARYQPGRSDALLKLKPYQDAEAVVIGHLPGKGRHAGRLGALQVETGDGVRFRLGTGFSDDERDAPPPLGSVVTYRYHGVTRDGVPRFASFLRLRHLPSTAEEAYQ